MVAGAGPPFDAATSAHKGKPGASGTLGPESAVQFFPNPSERNALQTDLAMQVVEDTAHTLGTLRPA